jgi:hypothetical protein
MPGGPLETLRLGIAHERAFLTWIESLQDQESAVEPARERPASA